MSLKLSIEPRSTLDAGHPFINHHRSFRPHEDVTHLFKDDVTRPLKAEVNRELVDLTFIDGDHAHEWFTENNVLMEDEHFAAISRG